jgi:tetratricopeptide (TPR) repeat protein/transcriptional regulator with XRE-family HTH domain
MLPPTAVAGSMADGSDHEDVLGGRPEVFGEIVRAYRRRLGLTQEELAEKAGLNVRSIGKVEAGRIALPRAATVRLLAGAFGLGGADLDRFLRSAAGEGAHAETGTPGDPPARAAVPAQLPPDVSAFTGRGEQLARLDGILAGADQSTAVVISTVSGTAGAGKTALAVRWAHRVRDRFPDGQLYLNLRGYDPDLPMTPAEALARLLSVLGVPARDVPPETDDRAARYRTQVADRRMLILLDNVSSVEQVRPLLPGAASCTVLVTSRDSLAGLVAVHGAHRVEVDLLSRAEARDLLRRLIGPRVDAEPDAATALAEQCARLPLALRVAAELAVGRPTARLADLVHELTDQKRRLDLLDGGGDPRASVAAVFSWSVRHLSPDAARDFGLLGLHPGPDLDAHAAAALAGTGVGDARRTLDLLVRAHLMHRTGPGRFGMHDLLRAYAAGLSAGDPEGESRAAQGRLFDHYLSTAGAAMDLLYPAEARYRPRAAPVAAPVPGGPAAARAWLDAERTVLIAVVAHTASHGWPVHTMRLSATLFRYFTGGQPSDALVVHGHARDAAQRVGDPAGEAQALNGLGSAHLRLGRHGLAIEHFESALARFRQAGDEGGVARALNNLGVVELRRGRYEPAGAWFRAGLPLFRRAGDLAGAGRALNNLGIIDAALGRNVSAADHHRQALDLLRRARDRIGEAHALTDLGIVEQRLGRRGPAAGHHRRALALFRSTGDQDGEAWARNGLGEVAAAAGQPAEALTHHAAALTAAVRADACDQQARAHTGIGAHHSSGDPVRAREHYERALALYTELGLPEADRVRDLLAALVDSGLPGVRG